MKIGKTLYVVKREDWRKWLSKNHNKEKEIWLVYYKKSSGKPRISYNDAVEEALCFGWIDSTAKGIDEEKFAQRFSPRRKNSQLSEMNRERIKRLIKSRQMTRFGLKAVEHHLKEDKEEPWIIPRDILLELKKDKSVWRNFQNFPEHYKRIRIAYIEGVRRRDKKQFQGRLNNFIKQTAKNKRFGYVKEVL